jgi:hypothetical protein
VKELAGELLHDDASEEKALSLAMLRTPEIAPDTAAAGGLKVKEKEMSTITTDSVKNRSGQGAGADLGQLRHAGGVRGTVYRLRAVCA